MTSNEVGKWADEAMFKAEPHTSRTPVVHLIAMNADPLGQIAACAKMYKGEVVRSLLDVTDKERKYYLEQMQLTKLKMPLEAVTFHFMLENVTRAFTHQLVRQRTAAYAQESMRFAVIEDLGSSVGLPPSLAGTIDTRQYIREQLKPETIPTYEWEAIDKRWYIMQHGSKEQVARMMWDETVDQIEQSYDFLVNTGMPAEDARGLLPTNVLTRVNYITNLRALLDHAGNRLCTQAQFEWRLVFAQIARAIREYDPIVSDLEPEEYPTAIVWANEEHRWQREAIADLLKPVCYQIGHCAFGADFDRKCSIRDRVQAHAKRGDAPVEWVDIETREWLTDPGAAR